MRNSCCTASVGQQQMLTEPLTRNPGFTPINNKQQLWFQLDVLMMLGETVQESIIIGILSLLIIGCFPNLYYLIVVIRLSKRCDLKILPDIVPFFNSRRTCSFSKIQPRFSTFNLVREPLFYQFFEYDGSNK